MLNNVIIDQANLGTQIELSQLPYVLIGSKCRHYKLNLVLKPMKEWSVRVELPYQYIN